MKSTDQQGMYGPKLLSCFRVAAGGCLTLDWPEKSTLAITRISSDIGLSDFTETVEDALEKLETRRQSSKQKRMAKAGTAEPEERGA
jgi:hypothetical protein